MSSFTVDTQNFRSKSTYKKIVILETIIQKLDKFQSKGYINTLDLTNVPIISELLPYFIRGCEHDIFIDGDMSMESYKWLYNIIILSLYLLTLESKIICTEESTQYKLKILEGNLFSRLDSSIKHHLVKRGIGISNNCYISLDTEFKNESNIINKLVSTQLALASRSVVKIPKFPRYTISVLDVESNKLHRLNKDSRVFNYNKVEASIQELIYKIRIVKHGNYEESMFVLNESLKMIRGLKYFDNEDSTVFNFPVSSVQPILIMGSSVSLEEVLLISSYYSKSIDDLLKNLIVKIITDISSQKLSLKNGEEVLIEEIKLKFLNFIEVEELALGSLKESPLITYNTPLFKSIKVMREKALQRMYLIDLFEEGQKISITISKNYYILSHLSQADLSMLSDFESIKEGLSIINGSFITLGGPMKFKDKNLHVRDTMLLAPNGMRSLAQIGKLYGSRYEKLEITQKQLQDMQKFYESEPEMFIAYAMRDALISLNHGIWMEEFGFQFGCKGIPISLSTLGRKNVKQKWKELKYPGYQLSSKYLIGDVSSTITPKGLNELKDIGIILPKYIANYKGGRNECFMYGIDRNTTWFDYDLISAYTTIMSSAGHPDYPNYRRVSVEELHKMSSDEILYSYIIIQVEFDFPENIKYPSIPCFVDENSTVYPLSGKAYLTGSEYLLARAQGCKVKELEIHLIPFSQNRLRDIKPFETILHKILEQRREYPKKSINNLMYKELGNSIYGSVVRGLSDKRKFDTKSKSTQRLRGDDISNPFIASWTTAFVRSVMGECLNSIQELGGKAVSVTTDGFITNLPNLESNISNNYLFSEFKKMRKNLSSDDTGLEIKHQGKGIIAWATRGQLGIESKIIATTGFQHKIYGKDDMLEVFTETFKSESKTLEFILSRLRSATEIFKRGGHVTMQYRDQQFRMHFDNKRVLQTTENTTDEILFDSLPLKSVKQGENFRAISKITKVKQFTKYSNIKDSMLKYEKIEDLAINNFVKGLLMEPPMFNLSKDKFKSYEDIVTFVKRFKPSVKMNEQKIAMLKYRKIKLKSVPKLKATEEFVNYVKNHLVEFDSDSFFRRKL